MKFNWIDFIKRNSPCGDLSTVTIKFGSVGVFGKMYSLKCETSKGTCDGAHCGEVASTVAAQREGSSGWV